MSARPFTEPSGTCFVDRLLTAIASFALVVDGCLALGTYERSQRYNLQPPKKSGLLHSPPSLPPLIRHVLSFSATYWPVRVLNP